MTLHTAILSFAVVAALLTVIPGLDTAIVLRAAISQGRAHAYVTALGVNCGALLWGIAAAVGASAILAASHTAYTVLKVAGAAYMIWLGVSMLWASRKDPQLALAEPTRGRSLHAAWLRGFGTNTLNPKVGVFYLAMIPQFMAVGVPPIAMGVLLAMVHNLIAAVWFTAMIVAAQAAKSVVTGARFSRITDRITGTVLVVFGVRLVASSH